MVNLLVWIGRLEDVYVRVFSCLCKSRNSDDIVLRLLQSTGVQTKDPNLGGERIDGSEPQCPFPKRYAFLEKQYMHLAGDGIQRSELNSR